MVLNSRDIKHPGEIKQNVSNSHQCPLFNEKIEIGVEWDNLKKLNEVQKFPYPHIHLHGNPLHAMLVYIDKDHKIRNKGVINSIEISRDSETFNHLMRKWSNPY